ncbi:MAG: S41 family peptidase [Lachnospirales bacterium]
MKNKGLFIGMILGVSTTVVALTAQEAFSSYIQGKMSIADKSSYIKSVLDYYYIGGYSDEKLEEEMYKGMISALDDPYSEYMTKEIYNDYTESISGTYYGIGAIVTGDNEENYVEIVTVFPGSPSEKAGLLPGNFITHVNGQEVFGDELQRATSQMKGEKGTTVNVTIINNKGEKSDITITREEIDTPTVSHEILENNIGYIKITNFDVVTEKQYFDALEDLQNKGVEKMIIDLRNNPGGLLDVSVKIADSLVPEGKIVYTEDKQGNKETEFSNEDAINIPLVILTNEYSASASEVVTGAAKDYEVATVVGETTFGKGLVQTLFPLPDGSAIKTTIAQYFTPKGNYIHDIGIKPDIEVPYDELENGFTMEKKDDIQLQAAIEFLNK